MVPEAPLDSRRSIGLAEFPEVSGPDLFAVFPLPHQIDVFFRFDGSLTAV